MITCHSHYVDRNWEYYPLVEHDNPSWYALFITVLQENINNVFIIEKRLLRNEYYISIQNMNILHKTFCE